ncbi:hypothetical protein SDC9_176470 [bioreactor metagenome]|uniref:Uncharacterized protein n=1 Tax=bioreactor metagenome TaxID=1076179 RepID=A0A645GSU6_9ZZZZ
MPHDDAYLLCRQHLGKVCLVQHDADIFLCRVKIGTRIVLAQNANATAVTRNRVHDQFDGRRFPRAVFAHQAENGSLWQRKVDVLQVKSCVMLRYVC